LEKALGAVANADVLIEGFRPGVMERLGLGPESVLTINPRIIYGRVTGWGQEGPLARTAGHDINYLALTGALAAIGRPGEPAVPPLNLLGDFGSGSMFLAFGIVAALFERERSGHGQVVDAAIIDGVSSFMTMFTGQLASGHLSLDRSENILGGAAPFYRCFICADGKEVAVGAIEPQFFAIVCDKMGAPGFVSQAREAWERSTAWFEKAFASHPRDYWWKLFEGTDGCVTPVLTVEEALAHPHNEARNTYMTYNANLQAAPSPRFSRSKCSIQQDGKAEKMLQRWSRPTAMATRL